MSGERAEIVLIGTQPEDREVERKSEDLLDGCIVALQAFSTDDLIAIAEFRHRLQPDSWMARMIFEYVDVWR